jgi:hypothetical protein
MPTIGVILSDTSFRRPPGDVGSAASYACPTLFHVARGVTAAHMVRPVADAAHNLPPFSQTVRRRTGRPVYDILTLIAAALGNRGVGALADDWSYRA